MCLRGRDSRHRAPGLLLLMEVGGSNGIQKTDPGSRNEYVAERLCTLGEMTWIPARKATAGSLSARQDGGNSPQCVPRMNHYTLANQNKARHFSVCAFPVPV